jgi:ammonia channel protein AmtB
MHPMGALVVGAVAGAIFVSMFTLTQNKWKIDDVLGVWPLHGLCGTWGGLAAGIFGSKAFGGIGGVSLSAQLIGTLIGVGWAVICGVVVYAGLKATLGLRLSQEEEYDGADLSIHPGALRQLVTPGRRGKPNACRDGCTEPMAVPAVGWPRAMQAQTYNAAHHDRGQQSLL